MRKSTQGIVSIGAAAVLLGAVALPASAAEEDIKATMEVNGGDLAIIVEATSVDLGAIDPGEDTDSVALGEVKVTDERAGIVGWVASAVVTDFTSDTVSTTSAAWTAVLAATIPASTVVYTAGTATVTGDPTVDETSPTSIATVTAVETATAVSGNNTAIWEPTIVVDVPDDALAAADYEATFTHSVS